MISTQLNIFDAIVLGILAISALIAFFRGFVKEVLSLFAWVGAAIATVYFFPQSVEFVKHHMKNETVAAGVAGIGTYVLALIILSIIASIIGRYVKSSAEVGVLDNMLGLAFGLVRGAFVVSLGYLMLSVTLPEDKENYPKWLQGSQTQPYAELGGQYLKKIAPEYIAEMRKDTQEAQERALKEKGKIDDEVTQEVKKDTSKLPHMHLPSISFEPLKKDLEQIKKP